METPNKVIKGPDQKTMIELQKSFDEHKPGSICKLPPIVKFTLPIKPPTRENHDSE